MRSALVMLLILASSGVALAAEKAKPPDKVHPADYRILVDLDKRTTDEIRQEIRKEVREALEARQRRLKWSKEKLRSQLKKEMERYEEDLKAIKHAENAERAARGRGDLSEAERWALLKQRRMRDALELARRAKRVEQALLALSLENWRKHRRREREIAEGTLIRLESALTEIDAKREAEVRERGTALAPPHE
jgi:hypothetical protein